MSSRLYVGNLSYDTDTETLRQAFSSAGEVTDAHVVMDRESGRSRGFGFVTMATPDLAKQAIETMNGSMLDGRAIRVNEAEERPRGGGGGGGFGGPRSDRGWQVAALRRRWCASAAAAVSRRPGRGGGDFGGGGRGGRGGGRGGARGR